jgi:hypothetical protein
LLVGRLCNIISIIIIDGGLYMGDLWIIILATIVVFVVLRVIIILMGKLVLKLNKVDESDEKRWDFMESFSTYAIFISLYFAEIIIISHNIILSDLEWYIMYCIFGIVSIVWCYFSWDVNSIKSLPGWSDTNGLKIKKAIVFFFIFVYVLVLGYNQTLNILDKTPVDPIFSIVNTTVVAAAIALDRFLNQIHK